MTHLTIRNVPPELSEALQRRRRARGTSLNQTVIELLRAATGLGAPAAEAENGLRKYAGTWTDEEADAFNDAVSVFGHPDKELWDGL